MKIIGLTGGIGSGKSTVAKIFETLDIPVYYADDEAKKLYITNSVMKSEIIQSFGKETYVNGQLNREYLGSQVFADKEKLQLLNSIVHPRLEAHYQNWLKGNEEKRYVLKEAAILIEMGGHQQCDKVILVSSPEDVRIQRVISRDDTTEEQVRNRMDKQMPEEEKKTYADFIIDNSGDTLLIPQVVKIHGEILVI